MDEKTLGLMVMGSILIAFGALTSFMHIRQQEQDAKRKVSQVRRLRVTAMNRRGDQGINQ